MARGDTAGVTALIDDLDVARRQRATRLLSDAVVVLVLLLGSVAVVRGERSALPVVAGCLALYLACSVMVRRGRWRAASVVLVATTLLGPVLTVVARGELGPSPYYLSAALLFALATMPLRGVLATLATSLASLVLVTWYTRSVDARAVSDADTIVSAAVVLVASGVAAALLSATMRATLDEARSRERRAQVAEAQAVEGEQRHRLFADHTDDLISLFDERGGGVYASPSHERVLGVAPASVLGRRGPDVLLPEDRAEAARAFAEALARGRSTVAVRARRPRDGSVVHLDAVLNATCHLGGRFVAVAARDVTQQRLLAEQLQQAQKMEALGRLAGGVAHDFNNLLTIIQTCTTMAASSTDEQKRQALLGEVRLASERGAALTEQLLSFSRRQAVAPALIDLAASLEDAVALSARLVGPAVRLETSITDGLWNVKAARPHIAQIILNLAANARDAMPEGGTLRVTAANRPGGAASSEGSAGDQVEIVVSDTGVGMTEETLRRVFDPFFTTKKPELGTGLGLPTCFGIVEQLGGSISVASEPGHGATFTVRLPRAQGEGGVPSAEPSPQSSTSGATARPGATVLVVDDDDTVRALMLRLVESVGHRVVSAGSVDEAARLAAACSVDVVLTDLVLGEESGLDLVVQVRKLHPLAAVVLVSGFSADADAIARHVAMGAEFLQKPFSQEALSAALDRAVDATPRASGAVASSSG